MDADGKTQYGQQQQPTDKGPEPVKLHSNSGFGGNNNDTAAKTQTNADVTKRYPKKLKKCAMDWSKV